jgi:hypothetical protein
VLRAGGMKQARYSDPHPIKPRTGQARIKPSAPKSPDPNGRPRRRTMMAPTPSVISRSVESWRARADMAPITGSGRGSWLGSASCPSSQRPHHRSKFVPLLELDRPHRSSLPSR